MGEAWETRSPKLHFDWQPSLLNSSGSLPNMGHPISIASTTNCSSNMITTNGNIPVSAAFKVPYMQLGPINEPRYWFPYLAPSHQPLLPNQIKCPNLYEKLTALSKGISKEVVAPLTGSGIQQKGFLVIDQSADKTTMVLCSGDGGPLQLLTSWNQQPTVANKFDGEDFGFKANFNYGSKPVLPSDFAENREPDEQSEMQEDTEELNALLYSDDESEFDEDEVTSTGHSPSTMITKDQNCMLDENYEEVASSAGSNRKRKIDKCYNKTSLMDTASSIPQRAPEFEDDAESSCGNEESWVLQDTGSSLSNKKMRKEKIRETVGILQGIIPGGKGKEAVVVLDEAIQYLKTLKLKAEAFGLNAC